MFGIEINLFLNLLNYPSDFFRDILALLQKMTSRGLSVRIPTTGKPNTENVNHDGEGYPRIIPTFEILDLGDPTLTMWGPYSSKNRSGGKGGVSVGAFPLL